MPLPTCPPSLLAADVALSGQLLTRDLISWSFGMRESCCEDHATFELDTIEALTGGEVREALVHAWAKAAAPLDVDLPDIPFRATTWHTLTGALWQALDPTGHWEVGFDQALEWAATRTVDPVAVVRTMTDRVCADYAGFGVRATRGQEACTLLTVSDSPWRQEFVRTLNATEAADLIEAAVATLLS